MLAIQDRKSERNQIQNETLVDRAAQDLENVNEILRDLKPPPRERVIASAASVARDSQMGINEVAVVVEETIRSSTQGAELSTGELSDQITLAKNFVTAEGTRNERRLDDKPIHGATASELKLAAAEANGTRIGTVLPNPIAIENAEKMSNASPEAHAIAHGNAIDIRIAEDLALPIVQSIKESHDRFIGTHGEREQLGSTLSTNQSIRSTHQRLLAISERFEAQQLAA